MPDDKPQDSLPEFHDEVAAEAVKIALAEEAQGVFENDNDNRGPRVDEYQVVGGTIGQPWCEIRKDGVYARKVREVSECKFVRI